MAVVEEIVIRRLRAPLKVPYKTSLKIFRHFDPIVAELRDSDGRTGWGEAEIHEGYGPETAETGLAFCREAAPVLLGRPTGEALAQLHPGMHSDPHAASVLASALEMLNGHPALRLSEPLSVPVLAPFHATDPAHIADEVAELLDEGYRTFKVKVGLDVAADLGRVAAIQRAVDGRASLRLDANQAYTAEQGRAFASSLDPTGIELFEQPCGRADWAANSAVAVVSAVPLMLDESIFGLADIDRAATIPGVGFVKLKLKKLGGLGALIEGLERIRARGLEPVLGDGTATDIGDWYEACAARGLIRNAGEMNGFLKLVTPLFEPPLPFADGAIRMPQGYWPEVDRQAIERCTVLRERFAAAKLAVPR